MKISVIGSGKTGSKVIELLGNELHHVFNTGNPPSADLLKESDAVIVFVPGSAVQTLLDMVVESGIPAAWGSTGYDWPGNLDARLKAAGTKWVTATNFSLGMNIVRKWIQAVSKNAGILNNPSFAIHEIHHIHKKDSPSGTALTWKEWLGLDAEISSERIGDVKGIHELTITTQTERITLRHEALDRALFAEGAIWAARKLAENVNLSNGLYNFNELFNQITGSAE